MHGLQGERGLLPHIGACGRYMHLHALRRKFMHEGHVTSWRTSHLFSVYSPMWGSLLDDKKETRGRRRVEKKEDLPPYVFSGSYTTTKYTNKQDVKLLSSGRPELE
jgi:hypothetical protein